MSMNSDFKDVSVSDIRDSAPTVVSNILDYDYVPIKDRNEDRADVRVENDITGKSTCTGAYSEFHSFFMNRYEELSRILKKHSLKHPTDISDLGKRNPGDDVTVIGLVTDIWQSKNDNKMIEIQDKNGRLKIIVTDDELIEEVESMLENEVLAFEGQLTEDKDAMFCNKIIQPDVPRTFSKNRASRSVKAAFISDIHLGADTFAIDKWLNFVDYVRETPEIEYVFVAGDLVEGIGVYPNQKEELDVIDIDHQYKLCAEAFKKLPDSVSIITCSGNHDSVRLAEPQPAIPERFTGHFSPNVMFTGNPVLVTVEGSVKIQMYHGMSINSFTDSIPHCEVEEPQEIMKLMLQKRHCSPLYGHNTRMAPESKDYGVLRKIPDIFQTGHVHTFGIDSYNNVVVTNTGTWQYQTDYQEKLNIVPDVGNVPIIDLSTYSMEVRKF